MAKPKYDYDSEEFYQDIFGFAMQGFNDAEIADALDLDPEAFNTMKNGKYIGWSKEDNERRSDRMLKVLARGRRKVNAIVRGRYLKAALGGIKTKNVTTVRRPLYDGAGKQLGDQVVQVSESEFESSPNVQALSTWLYHHDPEWRKVQKGMDVETEDVPTDIDRGVDIDAWIRKETEEEAAADAEAPQEVDNQNS